MLEGKINSKLKAQNLKTPHSLLPKLPMVQSTASTQLYVNPATGNDGGNGAQATPFKNNCPRATASQSRNNYSASTGYLQCRKWRNLSDRHSLRSDGFGDEAKKGNGIIITGSGKFLSKTFANQNVTFQLDNNAQLRGVTVTNQETRGTAVWVESTNPTIANNTFVNNKREGVFATGSASPDRFR